MVIGTSLFNGVIIEVTRRFYAKRTDDDGFIRLKVFNHSVFKYIYTNTRRKSQRRILRYLYIDGCLTVPCY